MAKKSKTSIPVFSLKEFLNGQEINEKEQISHLKDFITLSLVFFKNPNSKLGKITTIFIFKNLSF